MWEKNCKSIFHFQYSVLEILKSMRVINRKLHRTILWMKCRTFYCIDFAIFFSCWTKWIKNDIEDALDVIMTHLHLDSAYTIAITWTNLEKLICSFLFSDWLQIHFSLLYSTFHESIGRKGHVRVFKARLDRALSKLVWWNVSLPTAGVL